MPVVLITGSSRGIGLGIAKAFAACNNTIILNGQADQEQLHQSIDLLKQVNQNVFGYCANVADYSQAKDMINNIESTHGTIDILVNNAGIAHFGLFSDMTHYQISDIINHNMFSALNMTHLVVPSMVRKKSGSIINITSIWGVVGASCEVAYSTAKAGVIGFTKSLAKELAPSNIRVNAIACGAFNTRMNERLTKEEKEEFVQGIPLGRFGNPDEVGELALFLASEKSAYLTGQVINLDGGLC